MQLIYTRLPGGTWYWNVIYASFRYGFWPLCQRKSSHIGTSDGDSSTPGNLESDAAQRTQRHIAGIGRGAWVRFACVSLIIRLPRARWFLDLLDIGRRRPRVAARRVARAPRAQSLEALWGRLLAPTGVVSGNRRGQRFVEAVPELCGSAPAVCLLGCVAPSLSATKPRWLRVPLLGAVPLRRMGSCEPEFLTGPGYWWALAPGSLARR